MSNDNKISGVTQKTNQSKSQNCTYWWWLYRWNRTDYKFWLSRSGNITTLEGETPESTLIALIEFPTVEAVQAFANDPDYIPYSKARQAGSVSRFRMIDDTDIAGAIPYLPKG